MLRFVLLKVWLALEPSAVMAVMQTTTMRASMTAYSTAVGPSSSRKNWRAFSNNLYMHNPLLFQAAPRRDGGRGGLASSRPRRLPSGKLVTNWSEALWLGVVRCAIFSPFRQPGGPPTPACPSLPDRPARSVRASVGPWLCVP